MYNLLRTMLIKAQKERDDLIKNFCRSVLSLISEYQVSEKVEKGPCDDQTIIKVVGAYKKSLEKALDAFRKGGKTTGELFDQYNKEIDFCKGFLPKSVSDEELEIQIRDKLQELNITKINDAGKLTGIIIKNNPPGTVDGKNIKEIIQKILGV